MIGRNPEVATQPLFFDKKGLNLIYLGFVSSIWNIGIEPDLNRGLIQNINRKEQRVFVTEHGFPNFLLNITERNWTRPKSRFDSKYQ